MKEVLIAAAIILVAIIFMAAWPWSDQTPMHEKILRIDGGDEYRFTPVRKKIR